MRSNRTAQIVLFAILFLFFLQVLSDFIESIYAFGLLVTAFTIQLAAVLLLFTPLVLLLLRKPVSGAASGPTGVLREDVAVRRPWMIGLAAIALLGRLSEPLLDPGGKLVACGIGVGAFMLLFPLMLASIRRPIGGWRLAWGLLIAVMLSITFRTAGSSLDISEVGIYQFIAWVLAVLAGRLMWEWELSAGEEMQPPSRQGRQDSNQKPAKAPIGRVLGLCIGLASVVLVIYFAFASPTVISRWTAASYPAVVSVLVAALTAFSFLLPRQGFIERLSRTIILAWNALFVLMLVLTILPHQIGFPADPAAYPLEAPDVSPLSTVPLFLMLVLSPVIVIDFMLYGRAISSEAPSIRQLGFGFALASLFMLVMVFLHVFTTIYDYAAPIGPLFRDRFWLVYLLVGLGLMLPLFLVPGRAFRNLPEPDAKGFSLVAIGALAALSMGAAYLTLPRPRSPLGPTGELRVMTYNIQQGFDKFGNTNLPGQLAVIRQVQPDVLGLQESDTARVANGNVDAVRFFADNLGMYSYYGPTATTGTFGIALLSKYPIWNPHTFFMYSSAEQTAMIQAQIRVGDKTYNVFVTHLGNDGPEIQLENVLKRVDGLPDAILMGDFNFNPSMPQYKMVTALADAWLVRWPDGKDIPGLGPEGRIDYLFVSPGTQVVEAEYELNPASDHPYLFAILK